MRIVPARGLRFVVDEADLTMGLSDFDSITKEDAAAREGLNLTFAKNLRAHCVASSGKASPD
jgi:hypothetical protein